MTDLEPKTTFEPPRYLPGALLVLFCLCAACTPRTEFDYWQHVEPHDEHEEDSDADHDAGGHDAGDGGDVDAGPLDGGQDDAGKTDAGDADTASVQMERTPTE